MYTLHRGVGESVGVGVRVRIGVHVGVVVTVGVKVGMGVRVSLGTRVQSGRSSTMTCTSSTKAPSGGCTDASLSKTKAIQTSGSPRRSPEV